MSGNEQNNAPQAAPETPVKTGAKTGAKTGTRMWLRIILVASLGLNLLVIGLVGGAYLRVAKHAGPGESRPPEAQVMRELGLGPFLSAFPHEQRRHMARELREQVGNFRLNREALLTELTAILASLKAEPYDHTALEAAIDRQKTRINQRSQAGRNVLLSQIGAMTQQERLEFAGRLEKSLNRAMERRRGGK